MADQDKAGIVISEEVLADIAVAAARDVQGVSVLVPLYSAKKRARQESSLDFVKISGSEAELIAELWLRVKPDAKLTAVAAEVQRGIKEALQTTTDKTVSRVNLRIIGVDFQADSRLS